MAFTMGRECETGVDVLRFKFGEVAEDFLATHASSEVFENVDYGNPHSPDAGLSTPFARLYRDSLSVVHGNHHTLFFAVSAKL